MNRIYRYSVMLAIIILTTYTNVAQAASIQVSQPVQVTSNSYYERGQSIFYDGANYWLFYGRSASVTGSYSSSNPDIHDYVVYYKKAASVAGLAAATPTLVSGVAHNSAGYLGETGCTYFGSDVWAFATIDIGANCDLYGWYTSDNGTTWTEIGPIITITGDGQAHHDEITFNGELWVVEGSGNFTTTHSATPTAGGWSAPLAVGALTGGMTHFFIDGTDLYLSLCSSGVLYIYKYNAAGTPSWDIVDDLTYSGSNDPTLFKTGSSYVFAQAPWDGTQQYILQWSGTTLDGSFFGATSHLVTEGAYGTNPWVDMWPIGFTDNGGDSYLFFTSERNPGNPSSEIDGNIWYLKVDWDLSEDHFTYIQEAIDAAASDDGINVDAGTYTEDLSIPSGKTDLVIAGAGASSIIQGVDRVASGLFPLADPNIEILGNGTWIHGFTIKNPSWLNGFYSSGMVIGATDVEIFDNIFMVAGSDDADDVSQGLQTYATADISGLGIVNNTFTHGATSTAGFEGIYINKNNGTGSIDIAENIFSGDILRAITTEASNTTISENSIITNLAPGFPGGWEGINVAYPLGHGSVSSVTIAGNTVKGLTSSDGFQYGVVVGNAANTNIFSDINIANNIIQGHELGIRIREDADQVVISENSIYSNSLFSVKNDDPGANTLEATCNWWGSANASTIAGTITGTVTYTPYLTNGTDYTPGLIGFEPSVLCMDPMPDDCDIPPASAYTITPDASWFATSIQTIGAGDCHVYAIDIEDGLEYTFATGCGNGLGSCNFDTYLELYNGTSPYSMITFSDDACGQGGASVITWTANYTGVAYLKVRGWNSSSVGDYVLAYKQGSAAPLPCPELPDYTAGYTISPTTTWGATAIRTITADACHIYKVTVTPGNTYIFATGCGNGSSTSNFDTYMELYNGTSPYAMITSSDDACGQGGASVITWTANQTEVYLRVRGWNSSSVGTYILAYKEGGTAAVSCPTLPSYSGTGYDITPIITWSATAAQTITADACQIYKVSVTPGNSYTFATGCGQGSSISNFDTYMELYNGTSPYSMITFSDDACGQGGASVITWTANQTEVYLRVRGWNSSSVGNYILGYIQGSASAGTCPTLPAYSGTGYDLTPGGTWGATTTQTITTDACQIYKVTVTSGHTYTFATGCGNGSATSNFDTYMELYNGTSPYSMITNSDDACGQGGASVIAWTANQSEVYLMVRGWNSSSVGTYILSYIDGGVPVVTCPTLPSYSAPSGDYEITPGSSWAATATRTITADACHIYKVTLTVGKEYKFATGCSNGDGYSNFDILMELYGGSSPYSMIISNDDACGQGGPAVITWTANQTVVFLKVHGWNSSSVGNYRLAYKYTGVKDALTIEENQPVETLIKVYPNPANQMFTVQAQQPLWFDQISLNDFTGRPVRSWEMDGATTTFQINSSDLAVGVYVLSIKTSEGWVRKKVSIIR